MYESRRTIISVESPGDDEEVLSAEVAGAKDNAVLSTEGAGLSRDVETKDCPSCGVPLKITHLLPGEAETKRNCPNCDTEIGSYWKVELDTAPEPEETKDPLDRLIRFMENVRPACPIQFVEDTWIKFTDTVLRLTPRIG